MAVDALLDLGYACQRAVPASFQLASDQAVRRIGGIVLTECPVSGVARRLEIAQEGLARLVALSGNLCFGRQRRLGGRWLDDGEQRLLNSIVDPQPAEADATRLAVVKPAAEET